jgi:Ser/Thr protein kinase RdoA (MazF antagonist)
VTEDGIVWIDFEDCCSGPIIWDHATLLRRIDDSSPGAAATIRARHDPAALELAVALRGLQTEVWTVLHDARATGRLRA